MKEGIISFPNARSLLHFFESEILSKIFNRTFETRARGSDEAIDRQPAPISSSKTAEVQTELIRRHVKHYFARVPLPPLL